MMNQNIPGVKAESIKNAVEKEIAALDRLYLRPLQKKMYECSAKCCAYSELSSAEVSSCIDACSSEFQYSQDFLNSELNAFQDRVQRCLTSCNEDARDYMGSFPSELQVKDACVKFESCASTCIDKHIDLLPSFIKNVHNFLTNMKWNTV